jgi:hypothetical protein
METPAANQAARPAYFEPAYFPLSAPPHSSVDSFYPRNRGENESSQCVAAISARASAPTPVQITWSRLGPTPITLIGTPAPSEIAAR